MKHLSRRNPTKNRPPQRNPLKPWVRAFDRDNNWIKIDENTIISKVVGVSFADPSSGISRQTLIREIAKELPEVEVKVILEHVASVHDNNAIRVYLDNGDKDFWVGFLPKELSAKISHEIARYKVDDFAILGRGSSRHGIQLKIGRYGIIVEDNFELPPLPALKWGSAAEARKALRKK